MQTKIKGLLPTKEGLRPIDIFGYSSRGIPGLEIHGMGSYSKIIKEKIIYLTRARKLEVPLRRYSLCLADHVMDRASRSCSIEWLEIPLLVLFWSLSGLLPLRSLERCLSYGQFNVDGSLYIKKIPEADIKNIWQEVSNLSCLVTKDNSLTLSGMNKIRLMELFENIPGMSLHSADSANASKELIQTKVL